jgi:hypothetical protein
VPLDSLEEQFENRIHIDKARQCVNSHELSKTRINTGVVAVPR